MLEPRVINVTMDGNTQRVTTDTRLWSESLEFESDKSNSQVIRVFYSSDGSTPSSVAAGDAILSLGPDDRRTLPVPEKYQYQGEQFRLSNFYVKGTASDVLHVIRVVRILQPTT